MRPRVTEERARQLLADRGLEFVRLYNDPKTNWSRVIYRCLNKTHPICDRPWGDLLSGRGCKVCGHARIGIAQQIPDTEIVKLLESRGCTFIKSYVRKNGTRVKYRCADKTHPVCDQRWGKLQQGQGCGVCGVARTGIALRIPDAEIIEFLKTRSCTFIESYVKKIDSQKNTWIKNTWVKFRCANKTHVCDVRWNSLDQGGGCCRLCGVARRGIALRIPDAEIIKLLETRGCKFIKSYAKNLKTRVKYRCAGEPSHRCDQSWGGLHKGHGCPECCSTTSSYGERLSRQIIEHLTSCKTPKKRPQWLGGLELDGYCAAGGWAWEFDGEQHYKAIGFWGGQAAFDANQERRRRKAQLCRAQGVMLWRIDHRKTDRVSPSGMPALVAWYLKQLQLRDIPTPNAGRKFRPAYKALHAASDFVGVNEWREEMKRCEVTSESRYKAAYRAGRFKVPVPSHPHLFYKLSSVELFQKTERSNRAQPWQYTDEHDAPADLADHPNRNVQRLPNGKLKTVSTEPTNDNFIEQWHARLLQR